VRDDVLLRRTDSGVAPTEGGHYAVIVAGAAFDLLCAEEPQQS
jgi:hypothetical protein